MRPPAWLLLVLAIGGCGAARQDDGAREPAAPPADAATAIFAGGCFWCTESDFEKLPGVISAESGYTGGHLENPRYEDTHDGKSGHTEAVRVRFDPEQVSYAQLLEHFFLNHDPLDGSGQFCDRGNQYRPGIFFLDPGQKAAAEAAVARAAAALGEPVQTEVTAASRFWPAEAYHQDYYKKNALRYRYYRHGCGRDDRLEALRERLSPG